MFGVSNSEMLDAIDGRTLAQVERDTTVPFILLPDRDSLLLAINPVSVSFYCLDTETGTASSHSINGNEVRRAMDHNNVATRVGTGAATRLIIAEAASDGTGNVYAAIYPYPDEAAIVVKLTDSGTILGEYRFALPAFTEFQHKPMPHGNLVPSYIGVIGKRLFILSQPHFRVAVYQVPE